MIKEIWMNKEKQGENALYILKTRDAETANSMLVARELMDLARAVSEPEYNLHIAQHIMALRTRANEILAKVGQQS